jgi:hypothetical protein
MARQNKIPATAFILLLLLLLPVVSFPLSRLPGSEIEMLFQDRDLKPGVHVDLRSNTID